MLPKVREELDTLLTMLERWADSYRKEISSKGNNDYLIDDLQYDITTWMSPYVTRMKEIKYINSAEEAEFWRDAAERFEEFVSDVREGKGVKVEEEVDVRSLIAEFNLHKELVNGGHCGFEFTMEQRVKMGDVAKKLVPALLRKLEGKDEMA